MLSNAHGFQLIKTVRLFFFSFREHRIINPKNFFTNNHINSSILKTTDFINIAYISLASNSYHIFNILF